ncbi:NAD(P)/FAD-dependent oxidoreductase [Aliiroseovarius marinus]|uniref:NAD(P)/FAD-dependent oxidoreductase n=1 Tax=Aliiroseovarius marinus TaxID=2500159 RepID=UPI003D7E6A35
MIVKKTCNLWQQTCAEQVSFSALEQDLDVELLVIGGGYTGLSAALHAAQSGARVALIEAKTIGHGGSGRNVGLVNAGLWLPPEDITAKLGAEAGARLSAQLASAPDLVFDLIAAHDISCEATRSGTLHCAHSKRGMQALENRFRQARDIGAPVALLDAETARIRTGTTAVHGALFDPRAGTIQPLAYAKGLARAAAAVGALLFENSPAVALDAQADGWTVTTPQGRIHAGKLIVATNAYGLPIKGLHPADTVPVHFFQAATPPLPPELAGQILPGGEGCWDTAMVMSSWRKDAAGRLVIGAMGQLDHMASTIHRGWLSRKLASLFPALADQPLSAGWHGRIAMTEEYLPKTLMLGPNGMMMFGYSGRGIGPGTAFGRGMAEALLSGNYALMPRLPVDHHKIQHAGLRAAYYETGATLTHLVKDRI